MKKYIRINEKDDVAVALIPLEKGFELSDGTVLNEDIGLGHKIALRDIRKGEAVIKYDNLIGYASKDIHRGDHIHTHNLKTSLGDNITYTYDPVPVEDRPVREDFLVLHPAAAR